MLDRYNEVLISLYDKSQTLSPLWQRGERITQSITVTALCDYNDGEVF